jgi:hypothetical protein
MTSHYMRESVTTLHDFWRCVGTTFGHFLLGSHNFVVTALGSCVKWPLESVTLNITKLLSVAIQRGGTTMFPPASSLRKSPPVLNPGQTASGMQVLKLVSTHTPAYKINTSIYIGILWSHAAGCYMERCASNQPFLKP